MAGFIKIYKGEQGKSEECLGIAHLDDDDCRALTSIGFNGPRKGINGYVGIDEDEYYNLQALGFEEWTCRQILGTDDPPIEL